MNSSLNLKNSKTKINSLDSLLCNKINKKNIRDLAIEKNPHIATKSIKSGGRK